MASLYKQSVPVFGKFLKNLSGLLEKGQKLCEAKKMPEEQLLNYRIYPDMRGLTYQTQAACDMAKHFLQRVGGQEVPVFDDKEATFGQLQERIQATLALLDKADASAIDAKVDQEILMKTPRMGTYQFATGVAYLNEYTLANFHFHLTTAYCILRIVGVEINAGDYLKGVMNRVD